MTSTPPSSVPPEAGWYPDPTGTPQARWWDGARWTVSTGPADRYTPQRRGVAGYLARGLQLDDPLGWRWQTVTGAVGAAVLVVTLFGTSSGTGSVLLVELWAVTTASVAVFGLTRRRSRLDRALGWGSLGVCVLAGAATILATTWH